MPKYLSTYFLYILNNKKLQLMKFNCALIIEKNIFYIIALTNILFL